MNISISISNNELDFTTCLLIYDIFNVMLIINFIIHSFNI